MRLVEGLRRYFSVAPTEPRQKLTPEEREEARVLGEVLDRSRAPELLITERQNEWDRKGAIIRLGELTRDEDSGTYRLEMALAYPFRKNPQMVVTVGAQRSPEGFSVYVARDEERVYTGRAGDERLPLELSRAFGRLTMYLRTKGMA